MANMRSIGRLHAAERTDLAAIAAKSKVGAIAPGLPAGRELPIRGRFRLSSPSPEAGYQLDPTEIMSIVRPSTALDRAAQFQELAGRERFERMARRWTARELGQQLSLRAEERPHEPEVTFS
jgi:hypothetical protein